MVATPQLPLRTPAIESETQGDAARLPAWRDLVALLKARGLPRRHDDTRAAMALRLRTAAPQAPQRSRRPARPRAAEAALRVVPALQGPPAALDVLTAALGRVGGRRVAPDTALVSARRLTALRRSARRHGLTITSAPAPGVPLADAEPAFWAAARFVRDLHALFGWPAALLPPTLDRAGARQAEAYRRAWLGALEAQLDPVAEAIPETRTAEPTSEAPGCRETVLKALHEGCSLRIRYAAPNGGTQRTLDPRALETRHGHTYLLAFCHLRQAERLFRLDRIREADLLSGRA